MGSRSKHVNEDRGIRKWRELGKRKQMSIEFYNQIQRNIAEKEGKQTKSGVPRKAKEEKEKEQVTPKQNKPFYDPAMDKNSLFDRFVRNFFRHQKVG